MIGVLLWTWSSSTAAGDGTVLGIFPFAWTNAPAPEAPARALYVVGDGEFDAFMVDGTRPKCLLIEADYRRIADDALLTEYLATHPYVTQPTDSPANQVYAALVVDVPSFKQDMSDVTIGKTTANLGEISIRGGTPATDAWLFDRDWLGRGLRLYVGDPAWDRGNFRMIWKGVIGDLQLRGTNQVVLIARDMQHLLNQTIKSAFVEAGPNVSQWSAQALGVVYNVRAILIDDATHKYRINDGPVTEIVAVRVAGAAAFFTADVTTGTFTLAGAATGVVTADVKGMTVGTLQLTTAAELIYYLVVQRGYFSPEDIDYDSFIQLGLDCPQPLGLNIALENLKVYEAVDQVTYTVGAYGAVDRLGRYYVKRFDFDDEPVATITDRDIVPQGLNLEKVLPPVESIVIGAQRNQTPESPQVSTVTELNIAANQNLYRAVGRSRNPNADSYAKLRSLANPEPAAKAADALPSLFSNPADAEAEAARRMELWGVPRYVFKVACGFGPYAMRLGDAVTLAHPRYNLASGRSGVVIGVEKKYTKRRVDLRIIV